MKIVVLDGYTLNPGDLVWTPLEELGECHIYDHTPMELINERIGDAEIVFTNNISIGREVFEALPQIKYVGVLATGYDMVDVASAKEHGIVVTNIPEYGTSAVAQYTFALLLELCHHVGHHSETVVSGNWQNHNDFCYWDYPLVELSDKTIGLIGFGRIGRAVANIATSFGMKVLAYDSYPKPEFATENIRYVELDDLLAASDIVSLHCPLTESSREIINGKTISLMKYGVFIINTARGALINEDDIYEALKSGKIAGFAADVLTTEPPKEGSVLIGAPNCIITPHIAWASLSSRKRLLDVAAGNLERFLAGNPINVVS